MTERTKLTLVALASAAMPDAYFTGARASDQASAQDEALGIDCAIAQNASGRLYDVWATSSREGKTRLSRRVRAAEALKDVRGIAALGFNVEQILCYKPGTGRKSPTGKVSVAIMNHAQGHSQSLKLLTNEECSAVGAAIGAIHRIDPRALRERYYPAFNTREIEKQLQSWITNLKNTGHVPREITDSWSRIIRTEGLWSFDTRMVHGGFSDGDFLFTRSGLSAIHNWQNMQVNDPARDLAWIFAKLDQAGRDAVIAAYGRVMGSQLDDLIMLRANLWLQMEQVGDFIVALDHSDNERIIRFKAQVERLAQQLNDRIPKSYAPTLASSSASRSQDLQTPSSEISQSLGFDDNPTTVTVGVLLRENQRQQAMPAEHPTDKSEDQIKQSDIEEDATSIRPAYTHSEGQTLAGLSTGTGRHAAIRPPTLPDITGNHQSASAPLESSHTDYNQVVHRPGRHSIAWQDSAKEDQQIPSTTLETLAIDRSSLDILAMQQTEEGHENSSEHINKQEEERDNQEYSSTTSYSSPAISRVERAMSSEIRPISIPISAYNPIVGLGSDASNNNGIRSDSVTDLFTSSSQTKYNSSNNDEAVVETDPKEADKKESSQEESKEFGSSGTSQPPKPTNTGMQTVVLRKSDKHTDSIPIDPVRPPKPDNKDNEQSDPAQIKNYPDEN